MVLLVLVIDRSNSDYESEDDDEDERIHNLRLFGQIRIEFDGLL